MKKVKRVVVGIMTMVMILLLLPTEYMEVKAAGEIISTGQCGDNATYVLTADGTLTIDGIGEITGGWGYSIKDSINNVIINPGITSIGSRAFNDCSSLTSITLPNSIRSIGSQAFSNTGLTELIIPGSVKIISTGAFGQCFKLTTVTLLDGVTIIKPVAFEDCINLTSITIPFSVKFIEEGAFRNCKNLSIISIPCDCSLDDITRGSLNVDIKQNIFHNNIVTSEAVEPTCTEGGFTEETACNMCGIIATSRESTPAKGHNYVIAKMAVKPTCSENGFTEEWACSRCGKVATSRESIPAKGHKWDEGEIFIDPTYSTTGLKHYSCNVCKEDKYEIMDKLQKMEGSCGKNVTYELSNSGMLIISGNGEVENCPWSAGADKIKRVFIEDGVTGICANAFRGCSNLAYINIPDSVKYIGNAAFFGCGQLGKVTITCDCEYSSTSFPSYIEVERMHGEEKLNSAIEPNCTQSGWTEETVCSACNDVLEAKTEILAKGHQWNDGTVIKEATLTSEGFTYFTCTVCSETKYEAIDKLTNMSGTCGDDVTYELSEDGTLTIEGNGDMDTCPWSVGADRIKKVIISDGITSVGANAFRNCSNLVEISIPDSVAGIEVNAFRGCTTLESIDIPSGVTYIGNAAFFGCSKLTKLTIPCGCLRAVSAFPSYIEIELTHGEEKVIPAVEASCKKAGWTEETVCSVCGEVFIAKEEIPVVDHVWNVGTITKNPTATEVGEKTYICVVCNTTKTEAIDKLESVTGWKIENGQKVYYIDGEKVTDWQKIDSAWYYFDDKGLMETGWLQQTGHWYYLGKDGKMVTGWKLVGPTWYYFTNGGVMVTGWKKIGTKWYYFASSGAMATGWQKISDEWYYFDDGAMTVGWKQINSKWYYFETSGVMAADKWINDTYYVKANGVMATNEWIGKYYVDANGKYVKGKTK